jgi:release factor H-coupled RctB family protein
VSNITIISSEKNWIEQTALNQLRQAASLPGVKRAVGLPDLHPGRTPVGTVFITEGIIYPHIIGNDIGCGMSLFMTGIKRRRVKVERMVKRLEGIGSLSEIEIPGLENKRLNSLPANSGLGTIGGGNHFAELQETETVFDEKHYAHLGLDKNQMLLLIHSGSRGNGQSILDRFIKNHQAQKGLTEGSEAAKEYLSEHDHAVKWAALNRESISYRLLRALGVNTATTRIIDSTHNSLTLKTVNNSIQYIHRKGAAPADTGAVIIPGSRGALTYLVMPVGDTAFSGYSLAHGAGRKWERRFCKARLGNKYSRESIKLTGLKGRVVYDDINLLYEEAPEAYKNIDIIIQSLADHGLIRVIATLKPVLTYKA